MQENVGSKYHPHLAATAALEAIKIGIEKVGTTGMETFVISHSWFGQCCQADLNKTVTRECA